MSKPLKITLAATGTALVAAVITLAIALGITARDTSNTLTAQRQQITALHTALAGLTAKAAGPSRDVITCQDWQGMYAPVNGSVDNTGGSYYTITGSAGPPPLPQHCINH